VDNKDKRMKFHLMPLNSFLQHSVQH